jgi:hypothetical protein
MNLLGTALSFKSFELKNALFELRLDVIYHMVEAQTN